MASIRPRLIVSLALGMVLSAGCSSSGSAPTVSTATHSPSASPTVPAATHSPSASPTPAPTGPLPIQAGPLAPGEYATTAFDPPFTLTVGTGWRGLFPDDDDEMAMEGDDGAFFAITRVSQVIDPASGSPIDAPADLATWLATHPSLNASAPSPINISGLAGSMVEATPAAVSDVEVFAYPTGNMHFQAGRRVRFHVLPRDGQDLVIVVAAPESSFATVAERTEAIIQTVRIGS